MAPKVRTLILLFRDHLIIIVVFFVTFALLVLLYPLVLSQDPWSYTITISLHRGCEIVVAYSIIRIVDGSGAGYVSCCLLIAYLLRSFLVLSVRVCCSLARYCVLYQECFPCTLRILQHPTVPSGCLKTQCDAVVVAQVLFSTLAVLPKEETTKGELETPTAKTAKPEEACHGSAKD